MHGTRPRVTRGETCSAACSFKIGANLNANIAAIEAGRKYVKEYGLA